MIGRRDFVVGGVATCLACAACGDDDGSSADAPTTMAGRPDDVPPAGFGASIAVGPLEDVLAEIDAGDGFRHVPEARAYLVRYPQDALVEARAVCDDATVSGMEHGLVALYQKCTHLGCRVPECTSSGRFECQCHGAIFNRAGEYVAGPAPRGMDRFAVLVDGGDVVIDTTQTLEGLPIGTTTVSSDPTDVSCIGEYEH